MLNSLDESVGECIAYMLNSPRSQKCFLLLTGTGKKTERNSNKLIIKLNSNKEHASTEKSKYFGRDPCKLSRLMHIYQTRNISTQKKITEHKTDHPGNIRNSRRFTKNNKNYVFLHLITWCNHTIKPKYVVIQKEDWNYKTQCNFKNIGPGVIMQGMIKTMANSSEACSLTMP